MTSRPTSHSRIRVSAVLLALAVVAALAPRICAQDRPGSAAHSEVLPMFQFAKFVTWPSGKPQPPRAPLIVGFYNASALEELFAEANTGREMQIVVRRVSSEDDIRRCHILFVGHVDPSRLKSVLNETRRGNVLSVGDSESFAAAGGLITFTDDRGKFQINYDAYRKSGLKIHPNLLRMVPLVNAEGKLVDTSRSRFFD